MYRRGAQIMSGLSPPPPPLTTSSAYERSPSVSKGPLASKTQRASSSSAPLSASPPTMTGSGLGGSGPGGSAVPRLTEPPKGRALSCSECKRRKIKCDRECPCGPCVLRNDQARCKPVIRWEAGCSLSDFQILQNRVNELESRVSVIDARTGGPSSSSSSSSSASGSQVIPTIKESQSPAPPGMSHQPPQSSSQHPGQGHGQAQAQAQAQAKDGQRNGGREDDAVMMLEDL